MNVCLPLCGATACHPNRGSFYFLFNLYPTLHVEKTWKTLRFATVMLVLTVGFLPRDIRHIDRGSCLRASFFVVDKC